MAVGCGVHTAAIHDRDGAMITPADTLIEVEWTRVLNAISTAKATIYPSGDCCQAVDNVRSWRHKLVIYRDGRLVWEGPILDADWKYGGFEVQAGDVLSWLDRRVPHQDIEFDETDLADIAEWLIEDGFAPDDPGHSVQTIGLAGITGGRAYSKDVGQTGDHLRDLADTGIDFTAVGSRILILPEDHTTRVGSLSDADFPDGLTVSEDGVGLATRWVVHGNDKVVGEAGGIHPYYGLLERVADESSIRKNSSAAAAARSRLRSSLPAPVWIASQQATLSPDAAVDVPSLVPGWCVDVTSTRTCRVITQSLKIMTVRVMENGSGETVSVQLAPAGA
ncbi:hypothetical protein F5972_08060 [Microbispora cellulosiformans]|uniref:Minor tail protein n=1 Tax=Microbispora cellulosiformans TaxID=2614688 RepID=A0A5J5K652_9ACTN|nr:hypothetical protein [Microbispora cellulosiformans]KAA9379600.1 hypothetical protein F5972_08060 [Microbispora cellulosiformans]